MIKSLLVILGLVFSPCLKAQEWFPVGASWYYNQIILLEGETFAYFEVTGEVIIQGKSCSVINGSCTCGVPGIGGYFYQEGDKVFVYYQESDSFRVLYDFSLVAGDTLIVQGDSEVGGDGYFLIDSITTIQAGSQTLRVQHITELNPNITWGNKIIELIGSNGCLYPQVSFCDPITGGLRCYEDDFTGLINFQNPPRPCNYIFSAIDDPKDASALNVFPNPATTSVRIQSEKPIQQISLINNLGIEVYQISSVNHTEVEVDMHLIPAGLYRLKVVMGDERVMYRGVVVQR